MLGERPGCHHDGWKTRTRMRTDTRKNSKNIFKSIEISAKPARTRDEKHFLNTFLRTKNKNWSTKYPDFWILHTEDLPYGLSTPTAPVVRGPLIVGKSQYCSLRAHIPYVSQVHHIQYKCNRDELQPKGGRSCHDYIMTPFCLSSGPIDDSI